MVATGDQRGQKKKENKKSLERNESRICMLYIRIPVQIGVDESRFRLIFWKRKTERRIIYKKFGDNSGLGSSDLWNLVNSKLNRARTFNREELRTWCYAGCNSCSYGKTMSEQIWQRYKLTSYFVCIFLYAANIRMWVDSPVNWNSDERICFGCS